jgi:hypothetical protein
MLRSATRLGASIFPVNFSSSSLSLFSRLKNNRLAAPFKQVILPHPDSTSSLGGLRWLFYGIFAIIFSGILLCRLGYFENMEFGPPSGETPVDNFRLKAAGVPSSSFVGAACNDKEKTPNCLGPASKAMRSPERLSALRPRELFLRFLHSREPVFYRGTACSDASMS